MALDKLVDSTQLDADLTSVANAIRTKGGTSASLAFPAGFVSAIGDIPTGDDREDLCEPKDVDFIDFDGRLLYSYTAQEFLALSALPANPSYSGLTAQGWNWTLADAKEFVGKYGALVIGQSYTTSTGRTRIYLTIPPNLEQAWTYTVLLTSTAAGSPTIHWGDGTSTVWTASANTSGSKSHTYENPGDYVIEIEVTSGKISMLSEEANARSTIYSGAFRNRTITKVEIGDDVTGLSATAFGYMNNVESISIPTSVVSIGTYNSALLGSFNHIKGIVFPKDLSSSKNNGWISNCPNLRYISIPKGLHSFQSSGPLPNLRKLTMAELEQGSGNVTLLAKTGNALACTHYVVIGDYTTVATEVTRENQNGKIYIPASVTKITSNAYVYNSFCKEVHLLPTSPPTLDNVNAFRDIGTNLGITTIFYVPYSADHSILTAYQAATNWSTYASRMQEEPQ